MMKSIFFIGVIVMNLSIHAKDRDRAFSAEGWANEAPFTVNLRLHRNLTYEIKIHTVYGDLIENDNLSHGRYRIIKDTVVFRDEEFGITMKAVFASTAYPLKVSGITFIKGFDFVNNVLFKEWTDFSITNKGVKESNERTQSLMKDINKRHEKYAQLMSEKKQFNFEVSANYYNLLLKKNDLRLSFSSDNSYRYEFDGKLVSYGKWQKKHNTVILYDSVFSVEYKLMLIGDNILSAVRLPLVVWDDVNTRAFKLQNK